MTAVGQRVSVVDCPGLPEKWEMCMNLTRLSQDPSITKEVLSPKTPILLSFLTRLQGFHGVARNPDAPHRYTISLQH